MFATPGNMLSLPPLQGPNLTRADGFSIRAQTIAKVFALLPDLNGLLPTEKLESNLEIASNLFDRMNSNDGSELIEDELLT